MSGGAGALTVTQNSQNAIINWADFSIDAGELTRFVQPGSNAAVLNRVTGGNPSAIHGALQANGNVFLINPNGILVGPSGSIDVHGLVLSTLDVKNGEFIARGDMVFKGGSEAGVANFGMINAIGGDVFLIGRTVSNHGTITAGSGTVGLAAGSEVLLTAGEGVRGERLFVRSGSGSGGTGVYNDGSIEGAAVELKAHGNVYALAINNKGSIRATGVSQSGGRVFLRGAGGSVGNSGSIVARAPGAGNATNAARVLIEAAYARVDGQIRAEGGGQIRVTGTERVEIGGTLDVSSETGKGGDLVVEGPEIVFESGSLADVSGSSGGGLARIGGGFQGRDAEVLNAGSLVIDDGATIRGDATASGRGGNLILWSDGHTEFAGTLSATGVERGGFAEISGRETFSVTGSVDLSASEGASGTLLLDPTNITISAVGANPWDGTTSTISNLWLSEQLDQGTNVVISTNIGGGDAGNIVVGRTDTNANAQNDRVLWYQNSAGTPGGTLSLLAQGNVTFNTAVQSAGEGGLNVVAGWDGFTGLSMGDFDFAAVLATMNDGNAATNAAGLGGGSVFVGATNARTGVAVGSRWGETNIAGHDLILQGSTTIGRGWAQVGFNDNGVEYGLSRTHNGIVINEWWGNAAGNPQGKNYIALLGGTEFGTGDTLALDNRAFRGAGWGATGDITVRLGGRLQAFGGTTASYTQIGHGGILADGTEDKWLTGQAARTTRDGIQIAPSVNRRSVFSSTWRTNYAGDDARIDADISIEADGDILLMGARGFDGATDAQSTAVTSDIYSMIGHGGGENQGSYHGNIAVVAHGATPGGFNRGPEGIGIQLLGGRGTRSFAMIGHGSGYEGNHQSVWDQSRSGDITVSATTGAIRLLGHNQAIRDGNTNATLNTGALIGPDTPTPLGNASDAANLGSFVQIGHGGQAGSSVAAGGTFIMPGGTNVANIVPNPSMDGKIDVFAGGTFLDPDSANSPIGIQIRAGNRHWYYAMIGHGGVNHNASFASAQTPGFGGSAGLPFGTPVLAAPSGFNGQISVESDRGSIIAAGGDSFRSQNTWGFGYNFVRVGHGGDGVLGVKSGNIGVYAGQGADAVSGDIHFTAGRMRRDHAQIGHGGQSSGRGSSVGGGSGDIEVIANGSIRFVSPENGDQNAMALSMDYANTYASGVWDTNNRWIMLGHGGASSNGDHFGNILVRGTQDADGIGLLLRAGDGQDSFGQIGHGGYSSRSGTGNGALSFGLNGDIDIRVDGDISLVAGTYSNFNSAIRDDGRNSVQIGHGGYNSDPSNNDTANFGQTGSTLPAGTAGAGQGNWGHFGDIVVRTTAGNVHLMGGSTIPVGERLDLDGNVLPIADNGYLTGIGDGKGRFHWAQIGHGGYATSGDHHGNIEIVAENGGIALVGGMMSNDDSIAKYNWAQIGHGGGEALGHLGRSNETVRVHALGPVGDILLAAGNGNRNQALIGNGGLNFDGTHTGDIEVFAGRNIDLRGGIALERVVRRIGEFQEMNGANGGHANDLSEFVAYYGADGLGYVLLDAAASAGGGALTKLIGHNIQPGTVEFRLAVPLADGLFDAAAAPDYIDVDNGDGTGDLVEAADPTTVVGSIVYSTGEIRFDQAIVLSNNLAQPDVFVNYAHLTGIRNDALYANATIGHGGYASNSRAEAHPEAVSGFVNRGHRGNIDVRAGVDATGNFTGNGGSITAIAGNDQRTYVRVGHGGMDANAPAGHGYSGAITAMADGAITFRGGGGLIDNQHIAFNYYGAGNTEVVAVTTAYNATVASPEYATALTAGTRNNEGINNIVFAYAQIGHGGVTVHANSQTSALLDNNANDPFAAVTPESGHNGDILVLTNSGNIDFAAGGIRGYGHYAMVGHGGYVVNGNHHGDISVISGADLSFTAGGNSYRGSTSEHRLFAQIGHGGRASTGNLEGDISVGAAGMISFQGGDNQSDRSRIPYGAHVFVLNAAGDQDENRYIRTEGRQNHSQIGHGGNFIYGDKTGDITVTAGNGIHFRGGDRLEGSIDNNAGYLNYAMIGHGGYQSVRQFRSNLGLPANVAFADDRGLPMWHNGTTWVFDGTFGPDGTGHLSWPSDNSINALLGLGLPLFDGFSGAINVTATGGDIRFQGGTSVGTFAMIGHGGVENGGDHSGDISVRALGGDIDFNANRIEETGSTSTATHTFAKIGHGGSFSSGEQSGAIAVAASGEIRFKGGRGDSYAMIGHGGRESHGTDTETSGGTTFRRSLNRLLSANVIYRPGTRTGDISVLAGGDILFTGGNQNGDRAFVQIGHGGFNIHANPDPDSPFGDGHSGAINVISSGGGIAMEGGRASNSYAQIGHGGYQSFGNHGGDGNDNRARSDIYVEAATGIEMRATGRFTSNAAPGNFAQIGHGGYQSSFRDAHDIDGTNLHARLQPYGANYINPNTGVANVDSAGMHSLTPFTTNTDGNYIGSTLAQLGTFAGDITVRTTGVGADIRFIGPSEDENTLGVRGENSYVLLGHGGWRHFGDIEGDIVVESGGGIEFTALQGTALLPNTATNHNAAFAMLGHGGIDSGGSFSGNIDVIARNSIVFRGADSVNSANRGFVQLGHGGSDSSKASLQYREAIRDPFSPTGGAAAAPPFGDVGNSGNISVRVLDGDLEFLAGRDHQNYAQLGHGGYLTRDTHSGDITVNVSGGIRFVASIDNHDPAGDNPGVNTEGYVQLGHGGRSAHGSHKGDITVSAGAFGAGHAEEGRGIVFRSGDDERNYSQLGHGGWEMHTYGIGEDAVGLSGDINVAATGDILFVAGTVGGRNIWDNVDGQIYTQLGHGGYNSDSAQDRWPTANLPYGFVDGNGNPIGHNGNITVVSGGSIEFLAGDANRAYEPSPGDNYGRYHYAQLGHGGRHAYGNHWGDITVRAGIGADLTVTNPAARVYFAAGGNTSSQWADYNNYAQLGHGGRDSLGDHGRRDAFGNALETITVLSGGDLHFTAAAGGINSYVMLGHGGYAARGDHAANIHVFAENDIIFEGGMMLQLPALGEGSYGQYSWAGTHATDSNVRARSLDWAANLHADSTPAPGPPNGVLGRVNISHTRVVDGSIVVTIRDNAGVVIGRLVQQGNHLVAENDITADFGAGIETIDSGTIVADIGNGANVANGVSPTGTTHITFLRDVNPGLSTGTPNLAIEFEYGEGARSFAQLGNGGHEADNPNGVRGPGSTGSITVVSRVGDILFTGGNQNEAYVQLGHGGYLNWGDNSGDIEASALGGSLRFTAGRAATTYAQLGHGGRDAQGHHSGNILVQALGGHLSFVAGMGAAEAYAQLGHGGRAARGIHSGEIVVNVLRDIDFVGGSFAQNYVQLGHGGHDADNSNPGDNVVAIMMPDGNLYHVDGHAVGGPSAADRVGNSGGIEVTSIDGNLSFLAGAATGSYAQLGHGGQTTDGDQVGDIIVRVDADGSAGQGNLLFDARGDDVAGTHYAQLGHGGFYASGGHVGVIDVLAGGDIDFNGGRDSSYAQLGHGGRNDHRLNIVRVTATSADDRDADNNYATPGTVNQTPPDDRRDFANDRYYAGTHSGDITVRSIGSINFTGYSQPLVNNGGVGYAQLGHGGFRNAADPLSAHGDGHNGDITVHAGGLTMNGDGRITSVLNPAATITFESGMQAYSYVQIGHGGFEAFGNHFGAIEVAAAAGIDFRARGATDDLAFTDSNGNRSSRYSYRQIGHGGINASYDPYLPRALETRNTANPGANVLLSMENGNVFNENPLTNPYYAFVTGQGTYLPGFADFNGESTAYGQGSLMPLTTFYQTYVDPSTIRFVDHDGDPSTPMVPIVPPNRGQWFHINAPGAPMDAEGNPVIGMSGDIRVVSAAGEISLTSTPDTSRYGRENYVQVGHGGAYSGGDHRGNISVVAQGGGVDLHAGLGTVNDGAHNAYALIGHGGSWSGGSMSGDIVVRASGAGAKVSLRAGSDNQNYAMIGHGGHDSSYLSGAGTQLSGFDANGVTNSDNRPLSGTELRGQHLQYWYNPGFIRRTEYTTEFGILSLDPLLAHNAGLEYRPTITGDITVEGSDGVELSGSAMGGISGNIAPSAFAQIGHAGRSTEANTHGDITVNAGTGSVLAHAGRSDQNYAQIGHGGYGARGNHNGDISIVGGQDANGRGLDVRAGVRPDAYAQVGHGGFEVKSAVFDPLNPTVPIFRGHSGNISVNVTGDITFVAGTGEFMNSDENSRNYVQLGHGGYDADVHHNVSLDVYGSGVGHNGDIEVVTTGGRIFFGAGDADRSDEPSPGMGEGRFHYAQLGHGGYEARGEHHGNITVSAASDIVFLGGSSEDNDADRVNYAQLGHGGYVANGNLGRDGELISVTAGRDIIFTAGNSQASHAMLGNGGRASRGDHRGDIVVRAGRNIEFSAVQGRHLISGEEKNFALTRATEFGTQTGNPFYDLEGSNVVPGTIVITIPNGPVLRDDGQGNVFVADGDATMLASLGLTIGDVVASVAYTTGTVANGRVTFFQDVNPNNAASPALANLVTVSYESLEIQGSWVQLGHGGYDSDIPNGGVPGATSPGNTGDISVFAGGDVVFRAGVGAQAYAQLGHGGYVNEGRNVGNISLGSATERIGGGVILIGGNGEYYDAADAYVQIGHGGRTARGTHSGDISIHASSGIAPEFEGIGLHLQAGTRNNAYALVGHGGTSARSGLGDGVANMEGNSGDITIDTIGDVNLVAGTLNRGSGTLLQSNDDGNLYAMIGHGGYDVDVALNGDIGATGGVGYGNGIGHNGNITVISREGSVNVLAGDHLRSHLPSFGATPGVYDGLHHNGVARMDPVAGGRFHFAMIGHGGYESRGNHWGDITVHAGFDGSASQTGTGDNHVRVWGGLSLPDQDDSQQFAQIGHGGRTGLGHQGRPDDLISIMAAGNVEVHGGRGVDTYAQIGNGGTNARGDHSGNIQVFAGGDVSVLAGDFSRTQTPGNGIYGQYYYIGAGDNTQLNNNLDRAAALLAGGTQAAGAAIFRGVNGVIPGTLVFDIYNDSGVLIGTVADLDGSGTLRVVADFTQLVDGEQLLAGQQVGTVNYAGNSILFTTRVNPGTGAAAIGGADGVPNVVAKFEHVRTDRAYAQIGHGGYDADDPNNNTDTGNSGNITVVAMGNLEVRGGTSLNSYAQIGNGGYETKGASSGDIVLRAGGNVRFAAQGSQDRAYVQIGHGGWDADGNHSGSIIVSAGSGGLGTSLGLGLFDDLGDFNRDGLADGIQFAPVAPGDGTVMISGGTFQDSWVQLGHGGRSSGNTVANTSTMSGDIGVAASGDIVLQGGTATRTFAQIGHGGWEDAALNMSLGGDISVVSQTGKLSVLAGTPGEAYALIGHGSLRTAAGSVPLGTRSGAIYVSAGSWEVEPVGTTQARIGHRSRDAGNGLTAGNAFTLIATGADGTTSHLVDEVLLTRLGIQDHLATGGDGTLAGVNLGFSGSLLYNSVGTANLLATGDLNLLGSVQNGGTGGVHLVAGWDGFTGMTPVPLDFLMKVPMSSFDIAAVEADEDSWGNLGGSVVVGGGAQNAGAAAGSGRGLTSVYGHSVIVSGSDVAAGGHAQIGYRPSGGAVVDGDLLVRFRGDHFDLSGGDAFGAYAQIGHGGGATTATSISGAVTLNTLSPQMSLSLLGGAGGGAYAQLGHGGNGAMGNLSGQFDLSPLSTVVLNGGGGVNAYAQIGLGGYGSFGSKSGDLSIEADSVVLGGGSGVGSLAQIGHGGRTGQGIVSGTLSVVSGVGDIALRGGTGAFASAQIGHGGSDYKGSVVSQSVEVVSARDLLLEAGAGLQASTQIGHGGGHAQTGTLSGTILAFASNDIRVLGGAGGAAYSQIGHGGGSADANLAGNVVVHADGDITVSASSVANAAYAMIGHGDDYRGIFAPFAGTGERHGDVQVSAGEDIVLAGAKLGHQSPAGAVPMSGDLYLAASRANPVSGSGVIRSDADTVLTTAADGQLRIYLPRRANNQLAVGTTINGTVYGGVVHDTWNRYPNEFARHIYDNDGNLLLAMMAHENLDPVWLANLAAPGSPLQNDTALYSSALGNFSFYYDTITVFDLGPPPSTTAPSDPTPPAPGPDPLTPVDPGLAFLFLFPNDRTYDDWRREMESLYSGFYPFGIYYEGFSQYGFDGQSIFQWLPVGTQGSLFAMPSVDDPLRSQQQMLAGLRDADNPDGEEDEEVAAEMAEEEAVPGVELTGGEE